MIDKPSAAIRNVAPVFVFYLASAVVLSAFVPWAHLAFAMLFVPVLVWLTSVDLDHQEIPDTASLLVAALAVVYCVWFHLNDLIPHLATGVAVLLALWGLGALYFRRTGTEGLGIGDAKLFGAGALLSGPGALGALILLASVGGIAAYAIGRLRGEKPGGLPFGPFIAYAIFLMSAFGPDFWSFRF